MSKPRVLVTGGNAGIGFALCKQLAVEDGCHVLLGSRSKEKGRTAVAAILQDAPAGTAVELVVIDVADATSVEAAAAALSAEPPLQALVCNAGVGLAHGNVTADEVIAVNITGAKQVVEAFLPLVNPEGGRLVGTSSGIASTYCKGFGMGKPIGAVPVADRLPLTSFDVTWEQIDAIVKAEQAANYGENDETKATHHSAGFGAYGVSKAALTAYYMLLARENPNLVVSTCSPGFINTKMTAGFGAKLGPEQGTVSLRKCILGDLGDCKGFYYGSDGLRSPLNEYREPGDPEFKG